MEQPGESKWRHHGVRVVHADELDVNTPQTPGMNRAALEFVAEAGPGDFIYVPPYVPHQEINASETEPLSCVLCRSGQDPVVVNLDLPNIEPNPEEVYWVDNIHPRP